MHQLFEKFPNLYGDLSAGSGRNSQQRDTKHAVEFLTRFADRMLFARDYYGGDLHQFLQTLDLPQDVLNKIYFENAQRLVPV